MFAALKATLGAGATRSVIYVLVAALLAATAAAGIQFIGKQDAEIKTLNEKAKADSFKDSLARERAAFKQYKDAEESAKRLLKARNTRERDRANSLAKDLAELQLLQDEPDEDHADYYACRNVKHPRAVLWLLNYSGNSDAHPNGGGDTP